MKIQLKPIFSVLLATRTAWSLSKLSGSMSAARPVEPLLRDAKRASVGPARVDLPARSDEFVDETVVNVNLGPLGRVSELASQSAACVAACNNHHVIL